MIIPYSVMSKRHGDFFDIIGRASDDDRTGGFLRGSEPERRGGYDFGTFQGVFTPSILTIIGVVMYLRFGWVLGNVGIAGSLALVAIGSGITFLTGLSISTLATNMRMKGGGAYFMLSRSLGLESGAALGIPLALSQAIGVSFYIAGFAEALTQSGLPFVSGLDVRAVGLVTLSVLALVSTLSADIALKSQYFIMAAIGISLVSFFAGSAPLPPADPVAAPEPLGFWPVFAVFFPAVTGILSGLGMSGDLRNPGRSIPLGTIAAVLTGYVVYTAVPMVMNTFVTDSAWLRTDTMIMLKCSRWPLLVLVGVWAATLSSAVGSFLCAPRVLQALARDRILPGFLGRGFGATDDPRVSSALCFGVAAAGIALGDINAIAPILTMFNLSTYALLNFAAAAESLLANPFWRPTFRVPALFPTIGFAGCLGAMFMISPGWSMIALGCEAGIYILVKRRQLRTQFGDVRTGLLAALVRFALRRLAADRHAERNWRPNLLVFSRLPIHNLRMLMLARGISGGRSFVTLTSIVKDKGASFDRKALQDAVSRTGDGISLELMPRIHVADDIWSGITETIRYYGFGPVAPNTVLFGLPEPEHLTELAGAIRTASAEKRNVLLVKSAEPALPDGHLDIWWRGGGDNGALMLSLAVLLRRDGTWSRLTPRVNMLIHNRTSAEAEQQLSEFLVRARITSKTRILDTEAQPFTQVLSKASSDAGLSLIGLRAPQNDETDAAYAEYLGHLVSELSEVPSPVFVLAASGQELIRIFS